MIITTTNSIENNNIKEYLGVVNANIVIGTNIFSDYAASVTDILGGRSETYQNKLNNIYEKVINELTKKANAMDADAILGLHIDFDEISGAGKAMLMVSASGTAILLQDPYFEDRYAKYRKLNEIYDYFTKGFLSEEEYNYEKQRIIESYNAPIAKEIEKMKENQAYENQLIKKQQEIERSVEEAKAEETKKTFVFNSFKDTI